MSSVHISTTQPSLYISKDQVSSIRCPTHIHDKTSSAVQQLDESSFCFSYCRAKQFKWNKKRAVTNCINNKRAPTVDVRYVPNAKYLTHIPHQTPFSPIQQMWDMVFFFCNVEQYRDKFAMVRKMCGILFIVCLLC